MTDKDWTKLLHEYAENQEVVKKEREDFAKYPHIHTGKVPSEQWNVKYLPTLSEQDSKDGIEYIFISLIFQLDLTNKIIIEYCKTWDSMRNNPNQYTLGQLIAQHQQYGKYIVSDLKQYVERIIFLTSYLKNGRQSKGVPTRTISRYTNDQNKDFHDYDEFISFFLELNDFDNSFKHHIANHLVNWIGRDEPVLYVFFKKDGEDFFNPEARSIPLATLLNTFNQFYLKSKEVISRLSNQK